MGVFLDVTSFFIRWEARRVHCTTDREKDVHLGLVLWRPSVPWAVEEEW